MDIKCYNQIMVDGRVLNIIDVQVTLRDKTIHTKIDNQLYKNITLFVDTEENRGVPCSCYSNIPSKLYAAGRTFKTSGHTFKYI